MQTLLKDILNEKLPLRELNKVCKEKKRMLTLKSIYLKEIQEKTWDAAIEKYPQYTTEQNLQQFLALPYIKDKKTGVHPSLKQFCQKVVKSNLQQTTTSRITIVTKGESTIALGKQDVNELAYIELTSAAPNYSSFYITIGNVFSSSEEEAMIKVAVVIKVSASGGTDHHLKFSRSSPTVSRATCILFSLRCQASHN